MNYVIRDAQRLLKEEIWYVRDGNLLLFGYEKSIWVYDGRAFYDLWDGL